MNERQTYFHCLAPYWSESYPFSRAIVNFSSLAHGTLTEKGKVLQDAKLNDLRRDFECMYKRWKYHINELKRSIRHKEDPEFISEVVTAFNALQVDVNIIYDQIRTIAVPDLEIRRKNDSCNAITKTANEKAQCFINAAAGDPEDIPWPDTDSVFGRTESTNVSLQSFSASKFSDRASQVSREKAASSS